MSALWIDDRLVGPEGAVVSALDHGLTVGDGCFETIRVVRRTPFALTRHLARLRRSSAALGLAFDADDTRVRAACAAVLDADPEAGIVRVTLTGGVGPLATGRGEAAPTLLVATGPDRGWSGPADVVTVPWTRNEHGALRGVKSTSYAENVVALRRAHEQGASEALLANTAGRLCEGTGTNVVVDVGGVLVTPPLSAGCLAGVTRELVLELAPGVGAPVEERDVPYEVLGSTDEAFLTSSTRDVMAIGRIDGRVLSPAPGERTRRIADAFAALVADDLDP